MRSASSTRSSNIGALAFWFSDDSQYGSVGGRIGTLPSILPCLRFGAMLASARETNVGMSVLRLRLWAVGSAMKRKIERRMRLL